MHLAPDEFMLTMRNKEKKKIASQRVQNLKNKESESSNTKVNIIFYVIYCSENWTWAWQSIRRFTTVLIKSIAWM